MLALIKRAILKIFEVAGYEIIHRRASPQPEPDCGAVAPIAATAISSTPVVGAAPATPDYQLMMAQQELMAKLADLDEAARPIIETVRPFTMTSIERLFDLYKSVEYIVKAQVPGDMLECGVWRGGSMMLVARTLVALGDTRRTLFLLDTYEGPPKPDPEKDLDLWGNNPVNEWINYRKTDETSDWAYVSIDEVRANLESTGYPMEKVMLVKGMVEKTAATVPPGPLALVRLDTDWYASAEVGLATFWPRLSRKGILIVDDYGHYRGQRQAVDEYFTKTPVKLNRVDYSCRTILKTD
jgi:O-methyltransferase